MLKILKVSAIAAALAAVPFLSYASPAPPNQKEMAPLLYLIGTWNCRWQSGSHSGRERQVFEPAFDGAWLEEKEIVSGQVRTVHYTGYDPAKKTFVHVGPDADGTFELAQSPDTITWRSADGSFVHTKVSDTKRTMTQTDGAQSVSMTCTKTVARYTG